MTDHRYCEYRHCGVGIDEMKATAKFCGPDHKAAEHRARESDPPGTTYPVGKPYAAVRRDRRRPNRGGVGTNLYVVRAEVELVEELLVDAAPSQARDRLLKKVPAAKARIERKAAA